MHRRTTALEIRTEEARGDFLGPQLAHPWVEDKLKSKRAVAGKPEKGDQDVKRRVVDTIEAYGAALMKALKPVARYVRLCDLNFNPHGGCRGVL